MTDPLLDIPKFLDKRSKNMRPARVPGEPLQKTSEDQTEDTPVPSPDGQEHHSSAAGNDSSLPVEPPPPQVSDVPIADIKIGNRYPNPHPRP